MDDNGFGGVSMGSDKLLDSKRIRLFREPESALKLTVDDHSYPNVKVVRAFPLSHPDHYICFLNEKDEEIGVVKDPKELDGDSRRILEEELDKRYLGSVIRRIRSVRSEFGTSYWDVDTDRGRREFVVQGVQENVIYLGKHHLVFVDVDGNRFEIPDYSRLDKKSLSLLEMVL